MRRVPVDVESHEAEVAAEPSGVAASVDRLLQPAPPATFAAEIVTVEPHRFVPGLWTADAWLTGGAHLSLLGRSEADVRRRLEEVLDKLSR